MHEAVGGRIWPARPYEVREHHAGPHNIGNDRDGRHPPASGFYVALFDQFREPVLLPLGEGEPAGLDEYVVVRNFHPVAAFDASFYCVIWMDLDEMLRSSVGEIWLA